jgi:hypothetical protein
MLTHIDTYFSYVKLPKNSCLGKCSTCIEFAQQHLQAKSPIEAAQFAEACTNHLLSPLQNASATRNTAIKLRVTLVST